MKLERVCEFLSHVERYRTSGDGTQATMKCPFCGDSTKSNHGHLSVKLEISTKEPMVYQCFRADCGKKGALTTDVLNLLGCSDMEALMELATHNAGVGGHLEKKFTQRDPKDYEIVNLPVSDNDAKLAYINRRLGTTLDTGDLRQFKIQLSLYEFLNLNNIRKLAFSKKVCDQLDRYTIGFMSIFNDYLICRDVSPDLKTGYRYTMYRTSGKASPDDTKIFALPAEIDLLEPTPAEISVAEGPFSIIGAYLHGDKFGHTAPNRLWLANCGSQYRNTIMTAVKQYGLTDSIIRIWSDSEIKLTAYETLLKQLEPHMNVIQMYVHYNEKSDDFGHAARDIKMNIVRLK